LRSISPYFLSAALVVLTVGAPRVAAAANQQGAPLVSSYSFSELGQNARAWVTRQGPGGELFLGGYKNLITFDGDRWSSYPAGSGYVLRGLDVSRDGKRLWVGGTNEIGWFDGLPDGTWAYRSLSAMLPGNLRGFGDCWYAFAVGDGGLFVTQDRVFRWDGHAMRIWTFPSKTRLSAMRFAGTVFLDDGGTGVYRYEQDGFKLVIPASQLGGSRVVWIGPARAGWLLVTSRGLMTWDGARTTPVGEAASSFVRANTLSSAASLASGRIAVGTLSGGIGIVGNDGALLRVIDKESAGLPTDEVFSLSVDSEGGLWATTSAQVLRIDLQSSGRFFDRASSPTADPVFVITASNGQVYAATATNVYRIGGNPPVLYSAPLGLPHESNISGMVPFGDGVLVGQRLGVDFAGSVACRRVWSSPRDILSLSASKAPGHVYASVGLEVLDLDCETSAVREVIPRLADLPVALAQDSRGRLWIGTSTASLWVIPDPGSRTPNCVPASSLFKAIPTSGFGDVRRMQDGSLCLFSGLQAWCLARDGGSLQGIRSWPNRSVESVGLDGVSLVAADDTLWIIHPPADGRPACVASLSRVGSGAVWRPHSIDGLWKVGIPAAICAESNARGDTLYIAGSGGILCADANSSDLPVPPPSPIIRVLAESGDEGGFHAIAGPLPYSTRKVLIRVAVPTFERRPAVEPQVMIDGIDTGWTSFDSRSERELTGLRDGSYTAHIRTMSDAGAMSPEVVSSFQIQPPWWRRLPVAILFLLAISCGGYGAYLVRVHRFRRRAAELEGTVARRTEQLTRAIERADRANLAKSEFIARVSHDIRNPLNGIVGISIALDGAEPGERQRELVQALGSCARQLTTLIDDVLDFSRIEAGKVDLKPAPCSPRALLDGIATSLGTRASAAASEIEVRVDPTLPEFIMVDAHRLEEILLNYMTNAIRYAPGRIVLAAGMSAESPDILECSVRDCGTGFSEEEKASLFTHFTRLAAGPGDSPQGTGLGLALCRRLADLMGGSVGVETAKGSGALFFVRLPLIRADSPVEAVRVSFKVGKVLIVEDVDYNAWAFAAVLARMGVSDCDRAKDGREAIARFETRDYDAILLDRRLPDMDGIDVARKIRETEDGGAHVLIICVSAYSTTEDRDRCIEAGMDFFAGKPLTPEKLTRIFGEAGLAAAPMDGADPAGSEGAGDTGMLDYLAGHGGGGLPGQIERYIAILEACMVEIPRAFASGDFASVRRSAHAIAGHACLVEADALASCAGELDAAALEGDTPGVRALMDRLRMEADRVIAALAKKALEGRSEGPPQ
jgi:signal transduction histidine kinase/CheY-like chemotaxis protein